MRKAGLEGDFWPDELDELLLKACLSDGDGARSAWEDLSGELDIDTVSGEQHRLLPLLYRNLTTHGIGAPIMPRLKGLYRYTWSRNQLRLRDVGLVLDLLSRHDIPVLVLKGVPLILRYYEEPGLRPMDDFDILVPHDRARDALSLLATLGWAAPPVVVGDFLRFEHGIPLEHTDRMTCDLHWRVVKQLVTGDPDAPFWAASIPLSVAGRETRTLDDTDQLFHVCAHGGRAFSGAALRWVADALVILRSAGERIDVERFADRATRFRSTLQLNDLLFYLVRTFDAPLPAGLLTLLSQVKTSRREAYAYVAMGRKPVKGSFTSAIRQVVARYARLSLGWSLPHALVAFPSFVRHTLGLGTNWAVPLYAMRRIVRPHGSRATDAAS